MVYHHNKNKESSQMIYEDKNTFHTTTNNKWIVNIISCSHKYENGYTKKIANGL